MGKIKNKKGIFFTFIAIILMTVFVLIFKPPTDISLEKDTESIRTRIATVDNYVKDLETRYFESALRATTYNSLLSLILYMNKTSSYLTNLDAAFMEVAINGTINKIQIDSITNKKIMENNTLANWSKLINQTAKETLNVDTQITINKVVISQTNPWRIDTKLNLSLSVQSNVAEWNRNSTIATTISIEGFPDPYYLVNTPPAISYTNNIKRSSVAFNEWDISKVREHLRNGTYVYFENANAPSFLMRFTNNIASSPCCGIESLVNPNKINPSSQTESYVDYLFWRHIYSDCNELYNIDDLWDEFPFFKLDFGHVTKYNIQETEASPTC